MTHAGEFLRGYLDRDEVEQREFAARAGVSEGYLSKLLKGDRRQIRPATLDCVLAALPEAERGGFLRAYLYDLMPEDYHGFVASHVSGTRVEEKAAVYVGGDAFSRLDATVRRCFRAPDRTQILRVLEDLVENAAASADFRRGLEFFAKLDLG